MTDKTKWIDKNGEQISYGDILKMVGYEEPDSEFAPKEPFLMLVKYDESKDMIYISGMDDFVQVSEMQTVEDEPLNRISGVEIFASRMVYETNLNYFNEG